MVANITFVVHYEVVGIEQVGKDFTVTIHFEEGAFSIDVLRAYSEGQVNDAKGLDSEVEIVANWVSSVAFTAITIKRSKPTSSSQPNVPNDTIHSTPAAFYITLHTLQLLDHFPLLLTPSDTPWHQFLVP